MAPRPQDGPHMWPWAPLPPCSHLVNRRHMLARSKGCGRPWRALHTPRSPIPQHGTSKPLTLLGLGGIPPQNSGKPDQRQGGQRLSLPSSLWLQPSPRPPSQPHWTKANTQTQGTAFDDRAKSQRQVPKAVWSKKPGSSGLKFQSHH